MPVSVGLRHIACEVRATLVRIISTQMFPLSISFLYCPTDYLLFVLDFPASGVTFSFLETSNPTLAIHFKSLMKKMAESLSTPSGVEIFYSSSWEEWKVFFIVLLCHCLKFNGFIVLVWEVKYDLDAFGVVCNPRIVSPVQSMQFVHPRQENQTPEEQRREGRGVVGKIKKEDRRGTRVRPIH